MAETRLSVAPSEWLFLGPSLVCSSVIALAYDIGSTPARLFLSALILLAAWVRPVWSLCAFIFLLPVFGNKPATEQFHWLLMLGANLNAALAVRTLLAGRRGARDAGPAQAATFQHPVMLMVLMYLLVSAGSLTSLPWGQLWLDFRAAGEADVALLPGLFKAFFNSHEANPAYPILTVLLTFQAVSAAYFVHHYVLTSGRNALYFCVSFVAGLVLTLLAGLLDFYRLINLDGLRPLDPNINPWGAHLRLQSFFGHSGWLGEYVVLVTPFVLILMALRLGLRVRLALVALLLWLACCVTVLTYQRGGWVAYPLTALLVLIAVSRLRAAGEGGRPFWADMKQASLQALVSLALLVALSLAAVYVAGRFDSAGQAVGIRQYAQRFAGIADASDRTVFFRVGWRLGLLHPFLGGGSEGFYLLYEKEFLRPGGRYAADPIPLGTLYGTAHNVYMQTFSGKGLWGLVFLLLPVFYLLSSGYKILRQEEALPGWVKAVTLISICSCCGFLIYGHVQEFFYIQSLQFTFFITLAIFSASLAPRLSLRPGHAKVLWGFLGLGLVAHLIWEYAFRG